MSCPAGRSREDGDGPDGRPGGGRRFARRGWLPRFLLDLSPACRVFGFLVALTFLRVFIAALTGLSSIEAYYWLYGVHPALGYADHPGMIGWWIWLSTALWGDHPLGVRALTILAGGWTVWLSYLGARRVHGERTAELSAYAIGLAPLYFMLGAQATPDSPLLVFWAATYWSLAHALSGDSPGWWYAAGLFLGLGMNSKYTAGFLPGGVFLFLIASPEHRRWLRSKEPYLAAAVAGLVFSPTLVWETMSDWPSFQYQGWGRFGERGFDPRELWTYPLDQLALLTPVLCVAAWGSGLSALTRWKATPWPNRLAAALGLPIVLFFAGLVPIRTVRGHWPGPGYVTWLVLSAEGFAVKPRWIRRCYGGSLWILGGGYLLGSFMLLALPEAALNPGLDLAAEIRSRRPDFVIARDHHLASRLAYHLRPMPVSDVTALGRPSRSFALWWRPGEWKGKSAVIVCEEPRYEEMRGWVEKSFEGVHPPVAVATRGFRAKKGNYVLLVGVGYRPPPSGTVPTGNADER